MLFYTRLPLLLQPPVLWLSIVTFNNDAKQLPKWILCELSTANPTPEGRVTPPWTVYMAKFDPGWEGYPVWQTGQPALAGHLTYHVNVTKLKWEIIWTGGLPHLSGLPHLPGVPHLHVNRPLAILYIIPPSGSFVFATDEGCCSSETCFVNSKLCVFIWKICQTAGNSIPASLSTEVTEELKKWQLRKTQEKRNNKWRTWREMF